MKWYAVPRARHLCMKACHYSILHKWIPGNCGGGKGVPNWGGDAETPPGFAPGCERLWVKGGQRIQCSLAAARRAELGHVEERGERTELRRLMVWSKPSLSSRFSNLPPTLVASTGSQPPPTNQGWVGRYNFVSQAAKPCDRACLAFNRGSCNSQASHPSDLDVCSYCLRVAQKL